MDWTSRDIVNFIAFVFTWLVGAFTAGKIHEKVTSAVRENTKRIYAIDRKIVNEDGEPLLVSYKAHDFLMETCQRRMDDRYVRVEKRLTLHEDKLDNILDTVIRLDERGNK